MSSWQKLLLFTATLFLLTFPFYVSAATHVTEHIKTDTVWSPSGSPYIITSDVQIYPNATLRILPGVEVHIDLKASLIVGGELIARGEPDNLIKFTSNANERPSEGEGSGIKFISSAASANYKSGPRPEFIYDYANHQVLLDYDSGSILEYCTIELFRTGIQLYHSLPCIQHCIVRQCAVGVTTEYRPEIPIRRWFFFYDNLVEDCGDGLRLGGTGAVIELSHSILSQNTFRYCEIALRLGVNYNATFLFNNEIFGNTGVGITGIYYSFYGMSYSFEGSGPMYLLDNNIVSHNQQGILLGGSSCLVHNYITENKPTLEYWQGILGGGLNLSGKYEMVFNNTIQLNGVGEGGHGDGIALRSREKSQFILRRNNLGNSSWDGYDLYLYNVLQEEDCSASSKMVVDATHNSWSSLNPASRIYDHEDDMCAGSVDFNPVATSGLIPNPMESHPILISPEENAYIPGTTAVTFSWNPVAGATRYLVFTFGREARGLVLNKIIEVVNNTSVEITFETFYGYGMNTAYWFVLAGNDEGWSLPSEIRKFTYSPDSFVANGKVLDEQDAPVGKAFIMIFGGLDESPNSLADDEGNYTIIYREVPGNPGDTSKILKDGYETTYTFPRLTKHFNVHSNLSIISTVWKEALYEDCGKLPDPDKGTIVGTVVNENNQPLANTKISLAPSSGYLYYLSPGGNPDPALSSTGPSGKFVVLDVNPGSIKLAALHDGHTYESTITVYKDSVTADALILSDSNNGNGQGPPPKMSSISRTMNFGNIRVGGESLSKIVTVGNKGPSNLVINDISLTGLNASEFNQVNDCKSVPAGGFCTIALTFSPTLPFGKKIGALTISSNDPKKPNAIVKLNGQAPPPKISYTPKTLNFGNISVGSKSLPKVVTVRNKGTSDLEINDITIAGLNASEFSQINDCTTVPTGGFCTISLTFSPILPLRKKNAVLAFSSNDPKKPTANVKLFGVGK